MKKLIVWTLSVILCIGLFTGCGASSINGMAAGDSVMPQAAPEDSLSTGDSAAADAVWKPRDDRKIIYTAELNLESKTFDATRESLLNEAAKAGAYIQNSEEGGQAQEGSRWVRYTFRVPSEHYREFLTGAAESGNLRRKTESTQDVTAEYVDVEARLESLKTQEKRLQELAAQAQNLEDLLAIEDQLTDVRYQIESYTGQKKVMDNQITYSTVDVYLDEVETLSPIANSFGSRVGSAFQDSWFDFVEVLQDFVITLIYALPHLIVLAIVVTVVVVIVRRTKQKKAARRASQPKSAEKKEPDDKTEAKYNLKK